MFLSKKSVAGLHLIPVDHPHVFHLSFPFHFRSFGILLHLLELFVLFRKQCFFSVGLGFQKIRTILHRGQVGF